MLKRINSYSLIIITFILIILSILPEITDATARVEPSKFIFTLKPGERITDAIKVTNTQDIEAEFTAIIYDWTLDSQDRLVTFEAGSREDTLKGLIKFNPQRFKLAPGQSQYVRFTLSAPKKGEWLERKGIIFFEQELPSLTNEIGATIVTQIGTTVYLSFTETIHAFRFSGARVDLVEGHPPTAILDLVNQGQAHIRYQIAYKIVNESGTLLYEDSLGEQIILPSSRRLLSFPLIDQIAPGKYNLLIEASFVGTTEKFNTVVPFTAL
jgi:hypothetical protein